MSKQNYHQARKQKELARKARQQAKQERRSTRATVAGAGAEIDTMEGSVMPSDRTPGSRA